jgi:hypothetical protein
MGKLRTALGHGSPQRQWLRVWPLLASLVAAGLVVLFLAASPRPHPVTLSFLCSTNDYGREVVALEITNALPREVWWRIQTGGTNYLPALTLESYDGTYLCGVWHGIAQYSGEPPVKAHSSCRPLYINPNVHVKTGGRVWLVWSDHPESTPMPRSALKEWRLSFSYFLARHGLKRPGAWVRPKSNDPHVEELVVP